MVEKTCLVTGGTSGIGLVAATAIARQGATLVLVGRDPERTASSVNRVKRESGNSAVTGMLADLSSQADLRRLAAQFLGSYQGLHVLLNNAGATFATRQDSVDGLELTFALNHVAYFLLTNLLLDAIKASAPARIVNVSSGAHERSALNFDDLQNRRSYAGFRVYGESKLCNLYFTYELARRLEGTGVTVNALHPGFVATGFGRNNGGLLGIAMPIAHRFALSPAEGAKTSIYLATSPEVEQLSGKYFYKQKPVASSPASYDPAAARRLWEESARLTGLPIN